MYSFISKWISNGILNSINTKDKLYKVLIQTDSANSNTVLHERLYLENLSNTAPN